MSPCKVNINSYLSVVKKYQHLKATPNTLKMGNSKCYQMSEEVSKINVVELLEKKGFYEVLYAVAIKNKIRWIDIVYTVLSLKGAFSPTTIRKRLEDLEEIKFIEKKAKPKARAEYTYHATDIAKKYAKSIEKMIAETEGLDKEDFLLIDDPELVNEVITKAVEQGYDSPQDLIREALNKLGKKR